MSETPPVVELSGAAGGRDPATGRWLPGHTRAGGRKRGVLELRAVVDEALGVDQAKSDLIAAYRSVAKLAAGGDVAAARLLFDRLCGSVSMSTRLEVTTQDEPESDGSAAHSITAIFAKHCYQQPALAAGLAGLLLRAVGDPRATAFADAMAAELAPDTEP